MHALLLVLLTQTPTAAPPQTTGPASARAVHRPEDFSVAAPGESAARASGPENMTLAPPDPELTPDAKDYGFDLVPLPAVTFNSDTGFGLGAVLQLFIYGQDYRPYKHGITAQFFGTTTGFQGHYITWDAPHLLGPVRVEAHVEFHKDLYAPFYGPGDHTFPGRFLDGPDRFFGYLNVWTSDWVRFRVKPLGDWAPLTLYVGYTYKFVWLTPYPGSTLDEQRPRGFHGGRNGAVTGGILWDTRDDEQNAHSGYFLQAAARVARQATGSQFEYQGVTFETRLFFSLWTPRLVLALHGVADHLWGDVPFWEWSQIGGISTVEGLGGLDSVRGVPRNRFGGNTKALGNAELRWATLQFPWGSAPLELGLLGFIDTGRVWQPGQLDGKFFEARNWHFGTGAGVRLARRAAVIRADFGVDLETKRTAVYIAFGQLF